MSNQPFKTGDRVITLEDIEDEWNEWVGPVRGSAGTVTGEVPLDEILDWEGYDPDLDDNPEEYIPDWYHHDSAPYYGVTFDDDSDGVEGYDVNCYMWYLPHGALKALDTTP